MSFNYTAIRPLLASLGVIAPMWAGMALYAAPACADTPEAGEALQEIVVTAEKRESTVQKTPISITAISGDQITAEGLSSMREVAAEVPGISMRSSGPGQTEYEMRGLPSSGGSTATVGMYLNDTPLSAPAASLNGKVTIDPDLFDLSRVEVLRGPQGTLYGSSSMGGTIKMVTNQPKLNEFEAATDTTLSGTTGGGFNRGGSGMVNLPLVNDQLAVRLVGTDKYTEGWIDRLVVSPFPIGPGGTCGFGSCTRGNVAAAPVTQSFPRSNWEHLSGGRGSVLYKPTDALSIDLMAMYQGIKMGAPSQVDVPPGPDVLAHYQPFNIAEPYQDVFRLYSLTINYDFGGSQLTSATSHWSRNSSWVGDESEGFQSLLSGFYGFPYLLPASYSNDDFSKQTSEELRLTSTGRGPWQWIIGGFYTDFESIFQQFTGDPAYAPLSYGGAAANPDGIGYQADNPYHIKQYAVFSESSYLFANGLKATAGARWYKYESDLDFEQSGIYSETGNATQYTGQVSSSNSGVNPKVNIAYLPNPDLTIYAQAARGFRPGGVNIPVPVPPCAQQAPLSYSPDSLWNYELGEKGRLFDGRLTVNADYYYTVWHDVQQLLTPTCGFPNTQNAGTAISYGPEIEVAAQLMRDLSLNLNGTYTEAHLKDINASVQGQSIGAATPIEPGLALENVPRYTINAAVNYGIPLSDNYKLNSRLSATRVGPYHDLSYYYESLPAYTITDARVGIVSGHISAYAFVDNLANQHSIVTINTMEWSLPIPSMYRAAITTPRTAGVDIQYKF